MPTPTRPLRATAIQFNHRPGDKAANLETVSRLARQAAREHRADLAVFPEMCLTGYWHVRKLDRASVADLAEPVPDGPSSRALMELATELGISVGAGLIEDDGAGGLFNTYVVAMPDGGFAAHRKLHTFISEHMRSGDRYTVFDLPGGWRASILICYDNNIVENARMSALLGAHLIIAPHQTGGCDSRSPHGMKRIDPALWHARETHPGPIGEACRGDSGRAWLMRWLPARAHDNGLFLVFSNGVGVDDDEVRTGNSMVLDPYGRILAETGAVDEDIVAADLDPTLPGWSTGARWVKARRPELYAPLAEPTGGERDTREVRFRRAPLD